MGFREASPRPIIMSIFHRTYHRLRRPLLLLAVLSSVAFHRHLHTLSVKANNIAQAKRDLQDFEDSRLATLPHAKAQQQPVNPSAKQSFLPDTGIVSGMDGPLQQRLQRLQSQPSKVRQV